MSKYMELRGQWVGLYKQLSKLNDEADKGKDVRNEQVRVLNEIYKVKKQIDNCR